MEEDNSQIACLSGTRLVRMDPKGRIAIPLCHRTPWGLKAGMQLSVTANLYQQALSIYTKDRWETKVRPQVEGKKGKLRALLRHRLFANHERLVVDSQHRILISQELRKLAGITGEGKDCTVALLGVGEDLELWAQNLWEENGKNISAEIMRSEYADELKAFDV